MIAFIIFGTRGVTMNKGEGQFHCPTCGPMAYKHKGVRCFFTLYFIPLIPLHQLGEYVECQQCQGTYQVDILNYDPGSAEQNFEAMFVVAMKQVMIAMLLADGVIDDNEVKELQATFQDLAGVEVTEEDLREEIAIIQQQGSQAIDMVASFGPSLNAKGKEMVITAAYQIAMADGVFDPTEQQFLEQLADRMEITRAHLRGLLAELAEA
jgi:uncharacterized tellurite resistance protein B-like protein